jgi:hypothetical protein
VTVRFELREKYKRNPDLPSYLIPICIPAPSHDNIVIFTFPSYAKDPSKAQLVSLSEVPGIDLPNRRK